jgi:hypothetical protein
MNLWTWWTVWWVTILVSFACLETYALKHTENGPTLSRFMWTLGSKFPLTIYFAGMLMGGLAVHFWWNWCPALGSTNG